MPRRVLHPLLPARPALAPRWPLLTAPNCLTTEKSPVPFNVTTSTALLTTLEELVPIWVHTTQNNVSGGTTTYSDFAPGASGTYCLNAAGNGYLFTTTPDGVCPLAMAVDDSGKEIRIIDTIENNAGALLCQR